MKSLDSISFYDHQTLTKAPVLGSKNPLEIMPFLEGLKPKSRVLDLGCGTGEDLEVLVRAGHSAVGIEPSLKRAEQARLKNPGIEILEKNFLFLTLKEEWDGIWACRSLHHYESEVVQRVVATCFKGLKSGGALGIVIYEGDMSFQDRGDDLTGPTRFIRPYSENAVSSMIEQTGFKIKKVGRQSVAVGHPLPSLLILAHKI